MTMQQTINQSVRIEGLDDFTGRKVWADLHEAPDNSGIQFLYGNDLIKADLSTARNRRMFGGISYIELRGENTRVRKVEHIVSALYGIGIDNVVVELSHDICPRSDFGELGLVEKLWDVRMDGNAERKYMTLRKAVPEDRRTVKFDGKPDMVTVSAADGVTFSYFAYFPHMSVGTQRYTVPFADANYRDEIAPARGIFFAPLGQKWVMDLLRAVPGHGIQDTNALYVGDQEAEGYLNRLYFDGIYDRKEFVRHKIMDAVGAVALTGYHFKDVAFAFSRSGHASDLEAMRTLLQRQVFIPVEPEKPLSPLSGLVSHI